MGSPCSPLRYPGGKQVLASSLASLLELNDAEGKTYLEPYAGGAGAAFSLLFSEHVGRIQLNDADPAIYNLWRSILEDPDRFTRRIREVELSTDEWLRQKHIYRHPKEHSDEELGFSAFFLNRCNRSGIIANAGVIGGLKQAGKWKLDVRFNRAELEARVRKISLYSDRIAISNLDALMFLERFANADDQVADSFVYLDPPYFAKGSQLYLSYYAADDHDKLSRYLRHVARFQWVLTYDDVPEIRSLYEDFGIIDLKLHYSAGSAKTGSEVLVCKPGMNIPKRWRTEGLQIA